MFRIKLSDTNGSIIGPYYESEQACQSEIDDRILMMPRKNIDPRWAHARPVPVPPCHG